LFDRYDVLGSLPAKSRVNGRVFPGVRGMKKKITKAIFWSSPLKVVHQLG